MDRDNEERRLLRRFATLKHACDRSQNNMAGFRLKICNLVRRDVENRCPNHYEEVIPLFDTFDQWAEIRIGDLRDMLNFGKEVEHEATVSWTQKAIYAVEDLRKSMTNMRLNYMLWFRQHEDIPSETERLELLMNLPTEAEVEAERLEAYRSGGASLLKNDDIKASRE